ncbi:FecCD family ABC transporter permease [Phaeovulum vinaykumarii]|uniref:Iron complex transport system permease protein n=1 Tax=Phaeovulum vinaykumarii TaxID=407234 RepID=A0A1N7JLE9_9RHOB|nr:iron ABC transporter permease [Phaeovulum vinaykumarii]SIS50081.1 iron complex transport system permease protein [Phaeovulum vinaykumarii]SOB90086.1 iron complex transport system permease protein [Phaeovulum vinaykumarii]
MVAIAHREAPPRRPGRPAPGLVMAGLALLLAVAAGVGLFQGAAETSVRAALWGEGASLRDHVIVWDIRLPRLVLGALVGAALAVSGALMQGLFRNPLADPGLVGVGAGAGLGAVLAIVLGGLLPPAVLAVAGVWTVPLAAFAGGWITTLVLYRVATRGGRTSMATMLLAGIAIAALAGALTGVMIYLADDRQLRDLTFWGLGSLAGANWAKVQAGAPLMLAVLLAAPVLARGLNGLALGEAAAHHMGIPVERVKSATILLVAAATGAAVAVSGGIGFVGIVVPHLLRLVMGPDHRGLLPAAALLGAAVLILADTLARILVAPAELPIGIVTAVLGAPVFLWILLRRRALLEV